MVDQEQNRQTPIAVVGVSALFPGSIDSTGFWRDILAGSDLITDVPSTHWLPEDYYDADPSAPDKTYAKRGAFLKKVDFDTLGFGVPPNIVPATDTAQLLALIVAQRVLEDACGQQFSGLDRSRVSVILGVTSAQELLASMVSRLQRPVWVKALRESGIPEDEVKAICDRIASNYVPWQESTFPGLLGNVVAGRIANRLDLGGTNCVTDAACASTFSAVSMAVNELYLHQSDLAIVGGVDTMNDIFMYMCFSKTPALSKSGDCRPFSDQADGTMLGEGLGMVALKRLDDAERSGDRIYAVLKGVGASSDGRSKSVYAPVAEGQAEALRRAYAQAGYQPDTVELVEAHGTGTKAGDAAEFGGLSMVFDETGRKDRGWCALGSVKSQIGHTKAAAGAAGLFKVIMALHHRVLPPTVKIDRPNPSLQIERSPFHLNTRSRPWVRGSSHPRRASVSSFGFGGSNFHLALEEYLGDSKTRAKRRFGSADTLLILEAETGAELLALIARTKETVTTAEALEFAARKSQLDYRAQSQRLALVVSSPQELSKKLEIARTALEKSAVSFSSPDGVSYGNAKSESPVAYLFPGQGSQSLDMAAGLLMELDEAIEVWDRARELPAFGGESIAEVVYPRPVFDPAAREAQEAKLVRTEWAQPAIGLVSTSMLAVLSRLGVRPVAGAGHSFGELSALHAAGVFDERSLVELARLRGELMARAAETTSGAMLAVSATIDVVRKKLAGLSSDLVIANHNAPNQVVVSGPSSAIAQAEAAFSSDQVVVRRLPVATAFHSPLVEAAAPPFAERLAQVSLSPPKWPVICNEDATAYPLEAAKILEKLGRQLTKPVRFVEQVEALYALGARTFVEVGPGGVLGGLVSQILGARPHLVVAMDKKGASGVLGLWHALGRLVRAGVALDFASLWSGHAEITDPASRPKAKAALPIDGANYGKPYPPKGGARDLPKPNPARPKEVPMTTPEVPALLAKGASPVASDGLLSTLAEISRQTAEAHAAYQRAMASSHQVYLQTAEAGLLGLTSLLGAAPTAAAVRPEILLPTASLTPAWPLQAEPKIEIRPALEPLPAIIAPSEVLPAPDVDLTGLLFAVVAESTGYPVEMLKPEMDLESDLGVDSIKRVEILSMLRRRAPELPEVEPNELAALKTLAEIATKLSGTNPLSVSPPAAQSREAARAKAEPRPNASAGERDLKAILLSVVASATGYPEDMLNLSMDLESDLGVDSIKRVEILSLLRQKAPDIAEVDAQELAGLKTLGQIAARFDGVTEGETASSAPASVSVPVQPRGASSEAVARYRLTAVPARALKMAQAGLFGAHAVAVIDGGSGLGAPLVAALIERGVAARQVDTVPKDADGVIDCRGVAAVINEDEALAANRRAFELAREIAPRMTQKGGFFALVQDTGGDFGLAGCARPNAILGGLAGLAKTAALEWPLAAVKAIDLAGGSRDPLGRAALLAEELCSGGPEVEVGLGTSGERIVLSSVAASAIKTGLPLDANSVVIASGGARGVTAKVLIALAHRSKVKLVLLGRTPLSAGDVFPEAPDEPALRRAILEESKRLRREITPAELAKRASAIIAGREIRATLSALERAGSLARYECVDVADSAALQEVLGRARTLGPIHGLVHGAGVIADKRIAEKTDAQFERVFAGKVGGLLALLDVTASDPLRVIALFSSIAGRTGNVGQCDYAMANEILNKVAASERRRRPDCLVKAFGWGPWESGMVTPLLRARFEELGVPLISHELGAELFCDELSGSDPADVELVFGGEPRAEALLESTPRPLTLELLVNRRSHPQLQSHAIGGTPVVPVVLVLEWFARAAAAFRPGLLLGTLGELRVLRGIRLGRFDNGGDRFTLRCKEEAAFGTPAGELMLSLELCAADGTALYSASARMVALRSVAPSAPPAPLLDAWGSRSIYGDVLFHGPEFQVIRAVEGVSKHGISAVLKGVEAALWPEEHWRTDSAAFDGGLQLALLWSRHVLGGASLPTKIREVHTYTDAPGTGDVRCVLAGREAGQDRAVSDLTFFDAGGQVFAQFLGVETHRLPGPAERS